MNSGGKLYSNHDHPFISTIVLLDSSCIRLGVMFRPCLLLHSAILLGLSGLDAFSWIETDVAKEVRAGKDDLVVKCRVPRARLPEIAVFSVISNFSISLNKRDISGTNEKSLVSIDHNVIHVQDEEFRSRPGVNVTGSLNLRDNPGLFFVIDRNEIKCPEDSGVYICLMSVIKNDNDMVVTISRQEATVVITKPPESMGPILFYDIKGLNLNSRNYSEGTRLYLHCVGDAYLNSEIRWCIKRNKDATFAAIHEHVTTKPVSSDQCHFKQQSILTLEITLDNTDTEVLCESGYEATCGTGIVKANASFTTHTLIAKSTTYDTDSTSAELITSYVTSEGVPYKPTFPETTFSRNEESESITSTNDPQESTQSTDFHDLHFTSVPSHGLTSDTELVANSKNIFSATATRSSVLTDEALSTPTEVFLTEESTENTASPSHTTVTQNKSKSSQENSSGRPSGEIYSSIASTTGASQTTGSSIAENFTEIPTDTLTITETFNFLVGSTLGSSDERKSITATFETKPADIPITMLSFNSTQEVTTTRTEHSSAATTTQQSIITQPNSLGMQNAQQTQNFTSDINHSESSSPNLSIRTTSSATNDIDMNSSTLFWSFLPTFSHDAISTSTKSKTTSPSPTDSTETNTKETSSSVFTTDGTAISFKTTNGKDSTRYLTDMGRESTVVKGWTKKVESIFTSVKTHTLKNDNQYSGNGTIVTELLTLQSKSSELSTTSAPALDISTSVSLTRTHELVGENQSSGKSTILTERPTLHSNSGTFSSSWANLDISTSANSARTHALISDHPFSGKNTIFTEQPTGVLQTKSAKVLRTSVAILDNSTLETSTRTHALTSDDQSSGKNVNFTERPALESNTEKPTRRSTFQSNSAELSTPLVVSKVQDLKGILGRTTKLTSSTITSQRTRPNRFITTSPTTRRPKNNRHPAHHTKSKTLTTTPSTKTSKRRTTTSSISSKIHVTSTKPVEVVTIPTNWQTIQITVMTAMSVTVVVTMTIGLSLIWKAKLQIAAVKIKPSLASV